MPYLKCVCGIALIDYKKAVTIFLIFILVLSFGSITQIRASGISGKDISVTPASGEPGSEVKVQVTGWTYAPDEPVYLAKLGDRQDTESGGELVTVGWVVLEKYAMMPCRDESGDIPDWENGGDWTRCYRIPTAAYTGEWSIVMVSGVSQLAYVHCDFYVGKSSSVTSPGSPGDTGAALTVGWATDATASSEFSSTDWAAIQATGEPDTFGCGDHSTAWAPSSAGSDPEWLGLSFDAAVYATVVRVHETYRSGFIYMVDLIDIEGVAHTIWTGTDDTTCPGWFEISFAKTTYLVTGVVLYTQADGYEEVDAVELTGEPGDISPTTTTAPTSATGKESWVSEWEVVQTAREDWHDEPETGWGGAIIPSGRNGMLLIHAESTTVPAIMRTANPVKIGSDSTLKLGISSPENAGANCLLTINVDGEPIVEDKMISDTDGWLDLSYDLSRFSGETVDIEIVSSANNWWFEHSFIDYIEITSAEVESAKPSDVEELTGTVLCVKDYSKPQGSKVSIPVCITEAEKLGNMDFSISFDTTVLMASEYEKGSLTSGSLLEANIVGDTVFVAFTDSDGLNGDGTVIYIDFTVVGDEGDTCQITPRVVTANEVITHEPLTVSTLSGTFTVRGMKGDANGDGRVTAVDALIALKMAVGLIPVELVCDMNGDGSVTSLDATLIREEAIAF